MALTVHHLQVSQSERIPWLCEELQIPYKLVLHQRQPILSPQSIKDLNPAGQAPVIQDGNLTLAESGACATYIIHKYGQGQLELSPSHKSYADYLYWFHFANSNFQPHIMLLQLTSTVSGGKPPGILLERFQNLLNLINARLLENTWLAGDDFTAADVMIVFSLTTMRSFHQYELAEFKGILAYLQRVSQREGYQKARSKADPQLELMIDGTAPQSYFEKVKAAALKI